MSHVDRLDNPRRDPTANRAISHADKSRGKNTANLVRAAKEIRTSMESPHNFPGLHILIMRGGNIIKEQELDSYAETKIITHDGMVKQIITTVKEQVE